MAKKAQLTGRWKNKRPEKEMDLTPVELPAGYTHPRPLADMIASMVREEIERERGESFETIDEADDFEEEDPDTLDLSRYELRNMEDEVPTTEMASWLQGGEQEAPIAPQPPPEAPQETNGDSPDPDGSEPVKQP